MGKVFGIGLIVAMLFGFNAFTGQAAVKAAQPHTCQSPYIVKRGDTLSKIAKACETTVRQILSANPSITNPSRILVDQKIILPGVVSQVDAVENELMTEEDAIPVTGEASESSAEEEPAAQEEEIYRVQRNDTLSKIAGRFGVSLEFLLLANPEITNPNRIYLNQEIRIPGMESLEQLQEEAAQRREAMQQAVVASVEHNGERWIDVDLASQLVRAYEGDELVQTFVVSTGTWRYPTVTGQYEIWIKLRVDDMSGPGYYLKDVPYVMYFYKGYGLHGTYWHDNFGTPMSHGCVNLKTDDAAWLFDFASVGTLVNVH